jgi:hypothetical protein
VLYTIVGVRNISHVLHTRVGKMEEILLKQSDLEVVKQLINTTRFTKSAWYDLSFGRVYLRKGYHRLLPKLPEYTGLPQEFFGVMRTLDIATIEVDEELRGKGYFRTWLAEVEELMEHNDMPINVECVHEPFLAEMLLRRGYFPGYTDRGFSWFPGPYKNYKGWQISLAA